MDEKINGMEKESSLNEQENLKNADTAGLGPDGTDSGDDDWEINIDKLLEQADMLVNNDMLPPMPEFEEENNKWPAGNEPAAKPEQKILAEPENVPEPVSDNASDSSPEMDSDLDEINSLLEQANLNEKIDDDMLALLESATQNQEDEDNPDEVFDIFAEGDMPLEDMKSSDVPEQKEEDDEEESKKKSSRKKKKKKEKKEKSSKKAKAGKSEDGEKKPGLLAKITALFGGGEDFDDEEPDTAAEENTKILNELNGDEGSKPSKAVKKGGKKKDSNKDKKSKKAAKPKPKAKAKKPAPPKKKKEKPVEKSEEKPVKILNGKSFVAIVGLCFTIIAAVMIVTNFIPEYVDKQNARNAFRDGDYETVYKLFYDKKLSASEELLFNQSRVIRQMERCLEAYQNNIALGRELEAVDALMYGVENYQELWESDEYQVRNEVDTLYLQICSILESNYGVSQAEAVTIASYDKIEYTKALYTILGGNGVSFQEEEAFVPENSSSMTETEAESGDEQLPGTELPEGEGSDDALSDDTYSDDVLPEDILPEEEDILN